MIDPVTVPREFLKRVLQDATNNRHNAEMACASSDEDHLMFTSQQVAIDNLALKAGIQPPTVETTS